MLRAAADQAALINREALAEFFHTVANACLDGLVLRLSEHFADPDSDHTHLFLFHSSSRKRGCSDPNTRWLQRRLCIKRNRVLVNRYSRALESLLRLRA